MSVEARYALRSVTRNPRRTALSILGIGGGVARALPGVTSAAPRARAQALLAMGTHVVPVELTGVEAAAEAKVYRFASRVSPGRWLEPGERGGVGGGEAGAGRLPA